MYWAGSRHRRPAISLRVLGHVVLIGVLILVVGFVWLRVVHALTAEVARPRPLGTPKALGWGDHAFSNKAQLKIWLKQRGISYEVWASRHAAAVAVLEHRRFKPAPVTTTAGASPTHTTAAPAKPEPRKAKATQPKPRTTEPAATTPSAGATERRASGPSAQTGGDGGGAAGAAIWALALLLGAIAVAPTRVLGRVGGLRMGASHRTYLAAAAASIIVAMVVASMGS